MPGKTLRRIAVKSALSAFLIVGGLGAAPIVAPDSTSLAAAPGPACPDPQERAFLRRLNGYRKGRGAQPLVIDTSLMRAAQTHSLDMTKMREVRNHRLRNGTTSDRNVRNHGYPVRRGRVGENLAFGNSLNSGGEVLNLWQGSSSHNSKLVRKSYKAIGIARVYDRNSTYGWYWTAIFGTVVDSQPTC
jgi:uncharacterized protein YkwD